MHIPAHKQMTLWVWVFVLALALNLTGCGNESKDDAANETSANQTEQAEQTQQAEDAAGAPTPQAAVGGSPWVNSNEGGNLPIEQPELKDDLYLYTNYDYIADHQMTMGGLIADSVPEIRNGVTELIEDTSKSSPALDQLRIFYNQLSDLDARAKTGISEIKPYSDRIQAVSSIEELNELLSSDDFPFVPVLNAYVCTSDTRENNIVGIMPKFIFTDGANGGSEYYQETDDPSKQLMQQLAITPELFKARSSLAILGMGKDIDEAQAIAMSYLAFEGSYGKYGDYAGKWTDKEYGAYAQSFRVFTMDELQEYCSNIPIRNLLAKLGKDESTGYEINSPEWLSELNALWNNDNLDNLKLLVTLSMMKDCYPILDPNLYKDSYEGQRAQVPDAATSAYEGCNTLNTMSNAIAKVYVDDVLGTEAKERLTTLTSNITDSYENLFQTTPWMSDTAKHNAIEKLKHMTANILEPDGGYWDYSKLKLTPTDQGGSLLDNLLAIHQFRCDCDKELIGQPAKAIGPWEMIRATETNCFYDPATNSINILPGYVTSAVYTDSKSEQELLAGIGAVIGHEISHGFDYLGSQMDAYGTPTAIFSGDDANAFIEHRQKLVDYLNTIQISDGVYVDGTNKSVEGAADLCGVQAILETAKKLDDVDYAKFFQDYARLWCQAYPPGSTLALSTDTHPLNYLRANVNVQMFDEFYDAYGITENDNMYLAPDKRVVMWGPNA